MKRFHTTLNLSESNEWVQIFRAGDWTNSYKNFRVKPKELDDFVKNFDDNVLQTENGEVQFNYSHNSHERAAGWITSLRRNGDMLEGLVRWTKSGREAIENEEFKYVSAELSFVYRDEETGEETKNVLTGAALTNIPFVRGMNAIALSEDLEAKPEELLYLTNSNMDAFKTYLSALQAKEAVSLDEAEVLNKMFATLSEDEQAEVKEEVEAIEPAADEEAADDTEETSEESADDADEENEDSEEEEETANEGNLSQEANQSAELAQVNAKLAEVQAELSAKQAELDKQKFDARKANLSAQVKDLADKGMILPKQELSVNEFALSLSEKQQAEFLSIINAGEPVVDLSGEVGDAGAELSGEDAIHAKAETLSKEKGITYREALIQVSK